MSKIIGKGQSGSVYRPALDCKRPMPSDKYISKVMSDADATIELETYRALDLSKVDPDHKYYVGQPQECQPLDTRILESSPPRRILNYLDGGISVRELVSSIHDNMKISHKTHYDSQASVRRFLRELRNIFEAVAVLNSNGIYHCDINTNNMVYAAGYGMRLIDFGVSQKPPRYTHFESFKDAYWPWPIELNLLNGKDRLTMDDYKDYNMPDWASLPSDKELASINRLSPDDIIRGVDVWQLGYLLIYHSFALMKPVTIEIVTAMRKLGMKLARVNPKDRPTATHALKLYDEMLRNIK